MIQGSAIFRNNSMTLKTVTRVASKILIPHIIISNDTKAIIKHKGLLVMLPTI